MYNLVRLSLAVQMMPNATTPTSPSPTPTTSSPGLNLTYIAKVSKQVGKRHTL